MFQMNSFVNSSIMNFIMILEFVFVGQLHEMHFLTADQLVLRKQCDGMHYIN